MYYTASLVFAAAVTFYLVSKIAKMLHAKRPDIGWIFLASFTGAVLAFISFILLQTFVSGFDPMLTLALSMGIAFLVSSAAFKSINQMSWGSAITTSIANISIGVITIVAAVVLNGESLRDTITSVSQLAEKNASVVEYVATGVDTIESDSATADDNGNDNSDEEQLEPVTTELDFLPAGATLEKARKAKRVYKEPKYHVISINRIGSIVGKPIRIKRKNGSVVKGSLIKMLDGDAVVAQRLSNGIATTPISTAEIQKLEVYR